MKKGFAVNLIGLVFFLSAGLAHAQEAKTHTFTVTPQVSYIKYEEPDLMKETGIFYGFLGSYEPSPENVTMYN